MKYILLLVEILLVLLVFVRKKHIRNLLAFLLLLIMLAQFLSIYLTRSFIPEIAFSNIKSILVLSPKYFIFALIFIVILYFFTNLVKKFNTLKISNISIILLIIFMIFYQKSAIRMFFKEGYLSYRVNFDSQISDSLRKKIAKELLKEKIVFDSNVSSYITPKKYNVIVFFFEGISNIVISKELTPNLYALRKNSIDVINYYNHTASTFRGIRGQLFSTHQYSNTLFVQNTSKWKNVLNASSVHKNYYNDKFKHTKYLISLPEILKSFGYHTYFEMAIAKYNIVKNEFYSMFKDASIDEIFRGKQINAFSDKEAFLYLKDKLPTLKSPFFYGFYNLGTHLGENIPKDGLSYKDGSNPRLNVYHNLDFYFGKFLSWFNNSEFSKDTILIVTSDHASFPERDFINAFKNSSGFYIDKIPLIIYKKGITPRVVDAKNLNSLSLAPTICDILGITKAPNRFLGISIFDNEKPKELNKISTMGEYIFKVINNKVVDVSDNLDSKKIKMYQKFGG